jgi:membrane peptidoglycan carboxypeptidase
MRILINQVYSMRHSLALGFAKPFRQQLFIHAKALDRLSTIGSARGRRRRGYLVLFCRYAALPRLPDLTTITDYQPKIPLRVYSEEGDLLGEFGVERRSVVKIKQVPDLVKAAILSAEDERFYSHGGVDYVSMMRAALATLAGNKQGGGTITMQVAREFFLTREQTYTRKLNEVLLAYKIEANLSKDEILELYVNQINLGQRAYGFASAARIYFGKDARAADARRVGDAGRTAEGAFGVQPGRQPDARATTAAVRSAADA